MDTTTTEQAISEGIKLLDQALSHFLKLNDTDHGTAIANAVHAIIVLAESLYAVYRIVR